MLYYIFKAIDTRPNRVITSVIKDTNLTWIRFKQLTCYLHQLSSETTFLNWRARDWTEHSVDVNILCSQCPLWHCTDNVRLGVSCQRHSLFIAALSGLGVEYSTLAHREWGSNLGWPGWRYWRTLCVDNGIMSGQICWLKQMSPSWARGRIDEKWGKRKYSWD